MRKIFLILFLGVTIASCKHPAGLENDYSSSSSFEELLGATSSADFGLTGMNGQPFNETGWLVEGEVITSPSGGKNDLITRAVYNNFHLA